MASLVDKEVDRRMKGWDYTAFCLACEEGHVNVVIFLVERGADTSLTNYLGLTGWDCAELAGHLDICQALQQLAQDGHDLLAEESKRPSYKRT